MKLYLLSLISSNIGKYNEKVSEHIGLGPTLVQVDQQNFEKVFLLKSDTDSKVFSYIYSVHNSKFDFRIYYKQVKISTYFGHFVSNLFEYI